jgi:hypothetical protein
MSPRSIRRAAERRAEKEARKALRTQPADVQEFSDGLDFTPEPLPSCFATGPRTPEGKRISSMNAVKTALTGRTVLLPTDDSDAYRELIAAYEREYQPIGLRETELVQSLADTQWRLQRVPGLESAIYAKGRYEFAEAHAEEEITLRKALIDLDTHLKYEKQLRNLQLQESRLHRRYEKEAAELRQLQKERQASEAAASKTATVRERTQTAPAGAAALSNSEFVFSDDGSQTSSYPASDGQLSCDELLEAA